MPRYAFGRLFALLAFLLPLLQKTCASGRFLCSPLFSMGLSLRSAAGRASRKAGVEKGGRRPALPAQMRPAVTPRRGPQRQKRLATSCNCANHKRRMRCRALLIGAKLRLFSSIVLLNKKGPREFALRRCRLCCTSDPPRHGYAFLPICGSCQPSSPARCRAPMARVRRPGFWRSRPASSSLISCRLVLPFAQQGLW